MYKQKTNLNNNLKWKNQITWNWRILGLLHLLAGIDSTLMIWIEWALALCLAPISR